MEKLEIILPEGITRQDIFNLVASSNEYKAILTESETFKTTYLNEDITDTVLNSGLVVETERKAPQEGEELGEIVRVVTSETITTEKPNPETLEDFAKRNIKEQLLAMINGAKNKVAEKSIQEQIETIKNEAK